MRHRAEVVGDHGGHDRVAAVELLAEEVRVGCTLAVLQCLDRDDRIVFVLGDVLGLTGQDAADVLGVTHEVYRKRLSRVRERIRLAVAARCGIINPNAACRCARRVDRAIGSARVDPTRRRFVERGDLERAKQEIEHLHDVAALFRSACTAISAVAIAEQVLVKLSWTRR